MKKFLTLFLAISLSMLLMCFSASATDKVTVCIDDETITFDVEPQIIDGRTMVPIRKIFEHLGAEVVWYSYNNSFTAKCGYLKIEMQIDNNTMRVNGKDIYLDVPPIIKDGRTLVPLRAISEAFSADVKWIAETGTADIKTPYPKSEFKYEENFDKYHLRTSNGSYEYFDISIDGDTLTIKGLTKDERITNVGIICDNDNTLDKTISVKTNKEFQIQVSLSNKNIDDEVELKVYTKKSGDSTYWGYFYNVLFIEKNGSDYSFKKPLVWENNQEYMTAWANPVAYINTDTDEKLVALSNEICKDADSDYEKILKIHDWVAENIYYDYDYYYGNSSNLKYDAWGVYETRRSVCEGYANLTQALIHAQNIPCRKVSGYALGVSASVKHWTEKSAATEDTNHAWNQAYVDGRWINIDTTWDSGNKYQNGEFVYKGMEDHLYFDISDVFFSYNHKYLN